MSRVVILTNPEDPHSFIVREALRRKGAEAWLWSTPDFPTLQTGSLSLEGREAKGEVVGPEIHLQFQPITTIWARAPEPPILPPHIQEADRPFALRECTFFLRSLFNEVGSGSFWVNPPASQRRALLKPVQLRSAAQAGFQIPRTLCSNDPVRIREFLRESRSKSIYKSFFPATWSHPEGASVLFTATVKEEDLPEDRTLRATPGIFQELLPKEYELRITAMGKRLFATKLRSQEVDSAVLDWRAATEAIPMEPADLPTTIAKACHRLMEDLGIVFGCFDLIVTPQGEYVFLEVNEMGAFLWIEQQLPEIGLLDAFCEFLIQGTMDFEWHPSPSSLHWEDVIDEAERQLRVEAPKRHVISTRTARDA